MNETIVQATESLQALRENPVWYHALSLSERATLLHNASDSISFEEAFDRNRAEQQLKRWKEQTPFNKGSFFTDRLAEDHITEDEFLYLLGESIEHLQSRIVDYPNWLVKLEHIFETPNTLKDEVPPQENQYKSNLTLTVQPLVLDGVRRLQERIAPLVQQYEHIPFASETIVDILLANLPGQIAFILNRTMALELNVARLQNRLQGKTSEEKFQDFVRQTSRTRGLLPLLKEYPVLARQLMIAIDNWIDFGIEFLSHLCADWKDICEMFSPENDPGVLAEVQGGAGDAHRKGHSVLRLKFSSGFRLVYKPKSLSVDVHFQELLAWLNERGDHPPFRTIKMLQRKAYGWSEFIVAHGCTTEEEIRRFYERQGGYLALLYALKATDFHFENLIASGEHPILIDMEALFHPRVEGQDLSQSDKMVMDVIQSSVMRVGLLPQRIRLNEQGEGIDISGLGGQKGQLTPHPIINWDDIGTDRMRLIRQRIALPNKENRPELDGNDVNVQDYSDCITTGFTRMYWLLIDYRDELLAGPLSRFAHDEIRLIVRPTNTYGRMLQESFHPDLLRDALNRDRFFDRLWGAVERQPYLSKVLHAERLDLLAGDIPMFTTYPGSNNVYATSGECIADFLDEPSLIEAEKSIRLLDEQDLSRQLWFIQASLATLTMGSGKAAWRRVHLQQTLETGATCEQLLLAARAVGNRISDLALRDQETAHWLALCLIGDKQWMLLPAGPDLYSGTSGIILFLSYLGAVTGDDRYTSLAASALKTVRRQVENAKKLVKSVGVFDGWGATIYLLTHLGVLWNEPALFSEAEEIVTLLPDLIERDDLLDVIAGSAGCIFSLKNLYRLAPSEHVLKTAILCGDHLLACAQPMLQGVGWKTRLASEIPMTGFSHGAAGFALSLLELSNLTREERFKHTALEALAYERSTFSHLMQNWPDLREPETGAGQATRSADGKEYMTTWCHGAAGIGLSRLAALEYVDDATIREEINIALKTTIAHGFEINHSLCHGGLGNLETLLVATQVLEDPHLHKQVKQLTAMILHSINAQGWVTGIPLGVESPGLMTGLAGIGYELLRLAEPEKVPSVLLLAPPK